VRIFIGYEWKQHIAARVLESSLIRNSSIPLEIEYLSLDFLNFHRARDQYQTTEFSFTRFLVPALCDYRGLALFMDCDMLCMGDIAEIAALPMDGLALRVVKQTHAPSSQTKMDGRPQTAYPRKNWSSLMLMNCSELRLWDKERVETAPGLELHQFQGIPDEMIGELPAYWNHLDHHDSSTKLLHYTSGGPWLHGCENHPHAKLWFDALGKIHPE
jgi:hypothetical protein